MDWVTLRNVFVSWSFVHRFFQSCKCKIKLSAVGVQAMPLVGPCLIQISVHYIGSHYITSFRVASFQIMSVHVSHFTLQHFTLHQFVFQHPVLYVACVTSSVLTHFLWSLSSAGFCAKVSDHAFSHPVHVQPIRAQ